MASLRLHLSVIALEREHTKIEWSVPYDLPSERCRSRATTTGPPEGRSGAWLRLAFPGLLVGAIRKLWSIVGGLTLMEELQL